MIQGLVKFINAIIFAVSQLFSSPNTYLLGKDKISINTQYCMFNSLRPKPHIHMEA